MKYESDLYKEYATKLAEAANTSGVKETECWDLMKELQHVIDRTESHPGWHTFKHGAPDPKLTKEERKARLEQAVNEFNAAYDQCINAASPIGDGVGP